MDVRTKTAKRAVTRCVTRFSEKVITHEYAESGTFLSKVIREFGIWNLELFSGRYAT